MSPFIFLQQLLDDALLALSADPIVLSLQAAIAVAGGVAVYLLAYTVRDVILRTRSIVYQLACILLVAALPIIGFFLYVLIRPARTVKERQMERMLKEVLAGEKKIAHTVAEQAAHGFVAKKVMDQVIFSLPPAPEYEPYDMGDEPISMNPAQSRMLWWRKSCLRDGTTQMGKSAAMPPPSCKKAMGCFLDCSMYQSYKKVK
jgi:hypothetical protein